MAAVLPSTLSPASYGLAFLLPSHEDGVSAMEPLPLPYKQSTSPGLTPCYMNRH